jgi:hypothetical protein
MGTASVYFSEVFAALKKNGLLPENDIHLPSVCTLIAGERMRGSWWSHPLSHDIFAVNEQLADHPDVLLTKLIAGKVTFVHRELWRQLYAIGKAREEWQMKNLTVPALLLLKEIDKMGSLTTNKLGSSFGEKPGDIARDLEKRLLIHAEQVHTATGAHSKMLETWETWAKRIGVKPHPRPTSARRQIEQRLTLLNREFGGNGQLPWQKP